jgi:uncharacterized membrane protein
VSDPQTERAAAWGLSARHEPRWPATAAIVAALALYLALPARYVALQASGGRWIIPALEVAMLVPLQFRTPHRHIEESMQGRIASIVIIALVNLANVGSLVLLIGNLLHGKVTDGQQLIYSAILIWLTNVIVFSLWYWELDRGGPAARCHRRHRNPDFLFPQMVTPEAAEPDWTPSFLDYVYVSFTNATAFSPTDTMPLTEWAKMLMLLESAASFLTVGLVAARAVNILQ